MKNNKNSFVAPLPNRIRIFKSFEESEQDKTAYIISQSPIERLRQTVELILRVYNVTRESSKEKKQNKRITIIRTQ